MIPPEIRLVSDKRVFANRGKPEKRMAYQQSMQTFSSTWKKQFPGKPLGSPVLIRMWVPFTGKIYGGVRKESDLDNCVKLLLDSLKTVVIRDDSQVVDLHASRAPVGATLRIHVNPLIDLSKAFKKREQFDW